MNKATKEKYSKPNPYRGVLYRFPRAILAVAEISEHGTMKHEVPLDDVSYRDLPDGAMLYREAGCRHMLKEAIEGPIDPDFNKLHAAHEAWDALARLEIILIEKEKENARSISD